MKNTGEGRLEVTAIENGTVIDHIPASNLFKIIRILGLENENHRITFGTNLESKRMGTKAIIKINDRFCKQEEINRIAIVAPMAVVNIIRDFKVVEKHAVTIPETIRGFVKCANPKCVTNNEPVETSFLVIRNGDEIALRCRYCEKITHQEQTEIGKENGLIFYANAGSAPRFLFFRSGFETDQRVFDRPSFGRKKSDAQ